MPAAKEHIENIKMQAIATLDPVKKNRAIDTLEAFGDDAAIDAILAVISSTSTSEVHKHGNEAIQRMKRSKQSS
jgi:hypothetical protein